MAFQPINREISDEQRELQFLRHLAYRAATEGGKYLSKWDVLALEILTNAHEQDTAETSVLQCALYEHYELNPSKAK